jgi:ATP-dependent Clp protease ATP-binding subunit ClpA
MARGPETIMTDGSRRVIVMAQEEARLLNHGFIGTEHLLLGLAKDTESVSAQLLAERGLALETLRQQVKEIIGVSGIEPGGSPPFTPRAKKVLELSLHEALDLGHQDISPEHILLGLIAEGEGVAAQILVRSKIDLEDLWRTVEERTGATPRQSKARGRIGPLARLSGRGPALLRGSLRSVSGRPQVEACSFCGRRPPASGRLVRGRGASICEHCISEWGERLAPGDNEPEEGPTTNG